VTQNPPVLLFDLGGVVVDFRGAEGMDELTGGAHGLEFCRENWWRLPELERFERGTIAPDLFADAFTREWRLDLEREAFLNAFKHWVHGVFPSARDLLRDLAKTRRLACLSNLNVLHWERCIELGVDTLFETHFLSFELGARKPGREVYVHAVEALGVPVSDIVFFDDVSANVEAARAAGMRAFHVNNGDLQSAFSKAGVF